ncbi:MAG: hypothetical protein QOG15_2250 [Solirubrobacteraceae bacterium]|nr:hypothetical protein [Solirubrobacteraceae bacterium]
MALSITRWPVVRQARGKDRLGRGAAVSEVAETYAEGRAGRLMRAAEVPSATGALAASAAHHGPRGASAASGVALLAASACTRFGVFAAGMRSAQDPKGTVGPQRRRGATNAAGERG